MRIAVVGSGPAATACTKGLIERGHRVIMLDAGEELDAERQSLVRSLGRKPFEEWSKEEIARIKENPSFERGGVPRRRLFGSDFVFAGHRRHSPLEITGTSFEPTYARGGYSTVWGASMLPIAETDMSDWPISRRELEPYYRKVLRDLPMSAEPSNHEPIFPLYRDDMDPIPLPSQCADLLARIRARSGYFEGAGLRFGRSRLAVRSTGTAGLGGCISCGLCLYGCVPQAMYSTVEEIDALKSSADLQYLPGRIVVELKERADCVEVIWQDPQCEQDRGKFDAVFLGLGAVNTTRLLIRSLDLFDREIDILDSQKIILPILTFAATPDALSERKPILPGVFLDLFDPDVDSCWVHTQIYAVNEPVLRRLGVDPDRPRSLRRQLLAPGLKRLMVAWVSFNSKHSGRLRARLDPRTNVLHLNAIERPESAAHMRRTAWHLFRLGLRFGALFTVPAMQTGEPGAGHHVGGSFPMSADPHARTQTDRWGRPPGHKRIFAIDSTVFPSIPATTIALPAMANAWRIAAEAPLEF